MGRLFDSPLTLVLILVVILLLFGAPKLPGMARSLGQSMRIFKSEVKEMKRDDDPNVTVNGQPVADGQPVAGTTAAQPAAPQQAAPQQAAAQPSAQPTVQQPAAEQPTVITPQPGQPAPTVDQNQRPTA
ncbi:twin-arginine translocase TatA/TatE family subunit [Kocuria indica]|uniref:Sec-independent protein translocase protein TatA n=1 Tax=Kocuria marina subsp. indica TaxID=1049583 RepID=A0A6N9QWK4_9MICC|nr:MULTISPECIES: Sec-independent protein translocase subunit TatA [Kocuria]MCT1615103.1 Sec-independent protein translocase subunit TatA [Kocuria marina]NDO76831.1 twin-arginine translocase TatA/TatE family subunit [Kocuria indica]